MLHQFFEQRLDVRQRPGSVLRALAGLGVLIILGACTDREPPTSVKSIETAPQFAYDAMSPRSRMSSSISGGVRHACALQPQGDINCWGSNPHGQANDQSGRFVEVSAGGSHNCALRDDGTIHCWGRNLEGQSSPPSGAVYVQVTAGQTGDHSCALRQDGSVDCWGSNAAGQAPAQVAGPYIQISAGGLHTCGLTPAGAVACWGNGSYGQSAARGGPFIQVSAGWRYTCALRADGIPECWGDDAHGQLQFPSGMRFTQVHSGESHTCALLSQGRAECWGADAFGQGQGQDGPFVQVTSGSFLSCGLKADGSVQCWGDETGGAVDQPASHRRIELDAGGSNTCSNRADGSLYCWGDKTTGQNASPKGAPSQISVGAEHVCALLATGSVSCWGSNASGQGTSQAGPYVQIAAGGKHSCGIKPDGSVLCWGDNAQSQGGTHSGPYVVISAGAEHTCALQADNSAECWGGNSHGQASAPAGTFIDVSAGERHSCALTSAGAATCWGDNAMQQTDEPKGSYSQLSAGNTHTCALGIGRVVCWGDNTYGQLGTPAPLPAPQHVVTRLGPYTRVSAGERHTCAAKSSGDIECWGDDALGQLNAPTLNNRPPDAVPNGPFTVPEGSTVMFSAASSTDPDGDALTYVWRFDDGAMAGGSTASHTYPSDTDGSAVCAQLTVSDGNGGVDVACAFVTVTNAAPSATLSPTTTTVDEGSSFTISLINAVDAGNDALTYAFDCGSGYGQPQNSNSTSCPAADNGTITYRAKVIDDDGAENEYTGTATISNLAPVVTVGAGATITSGQTFSLTGGFSDAGVNDSPWNWSISWGAGQGTSTGSSNSQGASVVSSSKQYLTPGTFTVTLSVTDKDGATGSNTLTVIVTTTALGIDLKPGSNTNPISLSGNGDSKIPVAVLSTASFNAPGLVNVATARFGNGSSPDAPVLQKNNGTRQIEVKDVNGDGLADLVLYFDRNALVANGDLATGTTQLVLTATLTDGRQVRGTDAVRVIP